jgi:hypothetical protein
VAQERADLQDRGAADGERRGRHLGEPRAANPSNHMSPAIVIVPTMAAANAIRPNIPAAAAGSG